MRSLGRRRFLAAGAAAPALLIAACSDDPGEGARPVAQGGQLPAPDLDAMRFVARLEVTATAAYRRALGQLEAGRLGQLPPAGSELLQSGAMQHDQSAAALNSLLEQGGRTPQEDPNAEFQSTVVTPALDAAKSWPEVASLLRVIETALAATYLQTIHSTLQSEAALRVAAGIQATGQKRVALLNFLLGEYPAPDAFQKTDAAVRR